MNLWKSFIQKGVYEMKSLKEYMEMSYRMEIVEDKVEGGYVVSYPELAGCITCGERLETALANAIDAKRAWFEAALEENINIPEPVLHKG